MLQRWVSKAKCADHSNANSNSWEIKRESCFSNLNFTYLLNMNTIIITFEYSSYYILNTCSYNISHYILIISGPRKHKWSVALNSISAYLSDNSCDFDSCIEQHNILHLPSLCWKQTLARRMRIKGNPLWSHVTTALSSERAGEGVEASSPADRQVCEKSVP